MFGNTDGDVWIAGEPVQEAEGVRPPILRTSAFLQVQGVAVLVLENGGEGLGSELGVYARLGVVWGALEDAELVSEGDGEFGGKLWVFLCLLA